MLSFPWNFFECLTTSADPTPLGQPGRAINQPGLYPGRIRVVKIEGGMYAWIKTAAATNYAGGVFRKIYWKKSLKVTKWRKRVRRLLRNFANFLNFCFEVNLVPFFVNKVNGANRTKSRNFPQIFDPEVFWQLSLKIYTLKLASSQCKVCQLILFASFMQIYGYVCTN